METFSNLQFIFSDAAKIPESIYTLPLLKMIKEAQQQHGLRHQDYQRYRTYCSSRLQRIRKVLNFTQGDRKQFKKKVSKSKMIAFILIHLYSSTSFCRRI